MQLEAVHLKHDATGLEHLHIAKDDTNNVFSIGFATPPSDSTGVPHILEHTTLCGSSRYPVRDPFFKMLNRSLATYMNAFTAADYTFYPFSTVNQKDHSNLREIYLDATLFPRLRAVDFQQEGWRLEHKDPNDTSSPIEFKGVVYNEMKGQMSDSSYLFYILFQREMYKGTIYGNDSGGDPAKITDLTYEQLTSFHKQHYHPSNSKVFTYGSFPLEEQLEVLNQKLLSFSAQAGTSANKVITPWRSLRNVEVGGPVDPLSAKDRQIKSSVSYLCNDVSDAFESFSLRVLSSLLLDGHGAPLYQALIESGLGADYSPNTGYDGSTKTSVFSIGIQGATESGVATMRSTIHETLLAVFEKGFEKSKIDGLLHQMEISLKRKSANHGMSLLNTIASGWFNEVDPLLLLSWTDTVQRFKSCLAEGRYLENLLDRYLIANSGGTLNFTMRPDEDFNDALSRAEQEKLAQKISALSDKDRAVVADDGINLLAVQNAEEDISCLPTLTIMDIPRQPQHTTLVRGESPCGIPILWNYTDTGLTYVRIVVELENMPEHLRAFLPLFADCLTNLGTKSQNMAALDDLIKLHTGGISVTPRIIPNPFDLNACTEALLISAHCLDSKLNEMLDLIKTLLTETNFDNHEKLKNLIRTNASAAASGIVDSGHSFARSYASSAHTPAARISEIMNGMTQIKHLGNLDSLEDLSEIIRHLKDLRDLSWNRATMRCCVTSNKENSTVMQDGLATLLSSFGTSSVRKHSYDSAPYCVTRKAFFPLPCSVNFAATSVKGVPYTHKDSAALQVLAKLISNKYLHKEIREKGGAYGAGATYSSAGGLFDFYSYRDPNSLKTLDAFVASGDWANTFQWSQADLEEAKLSIFQGVDAPISVGSQGMIEFIDGITPEMRQTRRERLLEVSADDVKMAAATYLTPEVLGAKASSAILGQKADWLDNSPDWKVYAWKSESESELDSGAAEETQQAPDAISLTSDTVQDQFMQHITNPKLKGDGTPFTIEITDRAIAQLVRVSVKQNTDRVALRVALESGGCHGYQYVISLTEEVDPEEDIVFSKNGARVIVDEASLELIDGSKIDYTTELIGSEFKVLNNPKAVSKCGCDISIDIAVPQKG